MPNASAPARRKKTVTVKQLEANRRNAQKCTGPKTAEGKRRSSMNALKHGLTAATVVLPFENDLGYHQIRANLIRGYQPATPQELMLVDQIAVGYWRTIRSRRFETAMFDNQVRTRKAAHGLSSTPDPARDDEACVVVLCTAPEGTFQNYFRYDGTIERQYYRAMEALRRLQNDRVRNQDRMKRLVERDRELMKQVIAEADPDTFAEPSSEPPVHAQPHSAPAGAPASKPATASTTAPPNGFISSYEEPSDSSTPSAIISASWPNTQLE